IMAHTVLDTANTKLWGPVFAKVKGAVVFIDSPCAECLYWNGGPRKLLDAGAVSIKEFSSFESAEKKHEKAVFIVSALLKGTAQSVLQDTIKSSNFKNCVVFTTYDEDTHRLSSKSDPNFAFFENLESQICNWMGNVRYSCEILYAPLFIASFSSLLFLTPTSSDLFPLLNHDLEAIDQVRKNKGEKHEITRLSDVHFFSLPVNYQLQIRYLASCLNSLFEALDCKDEIFVVGNTSRLIATQLANLPSARQRRKVSANQASLLLVDRSLDTAGPSAHSDDSIVDKMFGILPDLPCHANNISVDMTCLSSIKPTGADLSEKDKEDIKHMYFPGSIMPPNEAYPDMLKDMMTSSQKLAISIIKKSLITASEEEDFKIDPKIVKNKSSVTPDEINALVEKFCGNAGAIIYHSNLLQLSLAAAQTLSHEYHEKWMELSSMEKILTQTMTDQSPIAKIIDVINQYVQVLMNKYDEEGHKEWTVEEILMLLVYICSLRTLADPEDDIWDELSSALSLAISGSPAEELPDGLLGALGLNESHENSDIELDIAQDVVGDIITKLQSLTTPRNDLQIFNSLHQETMGPPEYSPLIGQILNKILDSNKPELEPDMEHISTGLMGLLKTGFSMFKKVTPPRPTDSPILIIFIVGGVSIEEVRCIHRKVKEYNLRNGKELKVVVGSTKVTSPADIVDKLLFENNLLPNVAV
uniref:Sec1 family domain-containing protein 2 n=1 Tax=Ciona savignyi TaxID=51511 RepID=H2YU06_CIOSA